MDFEKEVKMLMLEKDIKYIERMKDLPALGSKSLSLLNGGAAVAMLGFTQALVEKPIYYGFKIFGLWALVCFLLGAFFASISFFAQRYLYIHDFVKGENATFWSKVVWGLLYVSAAFAFIGGALVARGVFIAL